MSQPQPDPVSEYTNFYVSPLELAIKAQDRRLVRTLVHGGVNVNRINRKGQSPLHVAAALKDTFIVDLLVKNGAELEARTLFFETPLMVAVDVEGNVDMVYYLLRLGANILARDDEGNSIKSLLTEEQFAVCVDICNDIKNGTLPVPNPASAAAA